jgi:inner membrane protein
MNPWLWAVGSLAVAYAELHCPGCYLIWIAAGGTVTALASFMFDVSLTTQIVIFLLSCSVTCICGNLVYRRFVPSNVTQHALNQKNLDMVGARGIVAVSIQNGRGKVKLGDTVWLAEGPNLQEGTPVMVIGMRGTVVTVSPL